jgi:hypothetical protein
MGNCLGWNKADHWCALWREVEVLEVDMVACESKALLVMELAKSVHGGGGWVLVGEQCDSPREFRICRLPDPYVVAVGVMASLPGRIAALRDGYGNTLLVIHDSMYTLVDLQSGSVSSGRLPGVYYEHIAVSGRDAVIVCEIGVVLVNISTGRVWQYLSKCIIRDAVLVEGGRLRVDLEDGYVCLDIQTGAIAPCGDHSRK